MKKIEKCILHIGTPKTGTTSIQLSLIENNVELIERGIYYPNLTYGSHIEFFNPMFLGNNKELSIENTSRISELVDIWENEFAKCIALNCDKMIISSEELVYMDISSIKEIKTYLLKYFNNICIIAYFRHFQTFIPSLANELCFLGLDGDFYDDKDGNFRSKDGYSPIKIFFYKNEHLYTSYLNSWISVFDRENFLIRPFDIENFYGKSLLLDFLHAIDKNINLEDEMKLVEKRDNVKSNDFLLPFLNNYSYYFPDKIENKHNPKRFLEWGYRFGLFKFSDQYKFDIQINYDDEHANILNKEIDFINQFFDNGYKFQKIVSNANEPSVYPTFEDIPYKFHAELFNNSCKLIGIYKVEQDRIHNEYSNLSNELEKVNAEWGKQKDYIEILLSERNNLTEEVDRVNTEWGNQRDYIEMLLSERNNLTEEVDRVNTEWGNQRDYIEILLSEKNNLRREVDRINTECSNQRDYIEMLLSEKNNLIVELSEINSSFFRKIINKFKK
ncbi:hypothetical protein [Paenibacillus sp. SI92]|uniref:hypothetical protein n=1 Tax=Paenibacillus sp. SI92 TaxID=3163027 RepID=UPI003465127E